MDNQSNYEGFWKQYFGIIAGVILLGFIIPKCSQNTETGTYQGSNAQYSKAFEYGYEIGYEAGKWGNEPNCHNYSGDAYGGCVAGYDSALTGD